MKTQRRVCVLWSLFTIVLLCFKADTYETPITRHRRPSLKVGPPKPKLLKLSTVIYSPTVEEESGSPAVSPFRTRNFSPSSSTRPIDIQSDSVAAQSDVSVTCSTAHFVLRVKPGFYGLDADVEELTLGGGCRSNGVLRPYGDILFNYPLTACDAIREAPPGYLVYKYTLHFRPSPKRFPTRSQRLDVDIECRYQRTHHVHQLVLKPTWKTAIMRKKLKGRPSDFRIGLMDDSWSSTVKSSVYQLGQNINFQASASHLPPGGKLYVSSCYASPSNSSENSLKYTIIDNFGCLVDSKRDPAASRFIYRTNGTIGFSLKAFQFTSDPETEISVHCHLSVTSEGPSPAHKSCTYKGNRWTALSGDHSLCDCCDSKCVTSKTRRSMMEGFASSQLLSISDQTDEDGFLPVASSTVFISTEDQRTGTGNMDQRDVREYLWRSVDVLRYDGKDDERFAEDEEDEEELEEDGGQESRVNVGTTAAPDTRTSFFRNVVSVEKGNAFEEEGSGVEGVTLGEEIHERSKHNQAKVEGPIPENVKPPESKEPEEAGNVAEDQNRTRTFRLGLKTDEGLDDVADGEKSTWYFTWR